MNLDIVSKGLIILIIGWLAYLLGFYGLSPFFLTEDTVASHSILMGEHLMHYESPKHKKVSDFSIFIALLVMLIISIIISKRVEKMEEKEVHRDLQVLKRVLSEDEKKLLDEVQRSGEITQDSLRFRLNWSKAKASTIISHLDRSGLLQRRREGKTYVVLLAPSFSK